MKKLLLLFGVLLFLVSCSQEESLMPPKENDAGVSQNSCMKQAEQRLRNIIKNHRFLTRSNGVNIKEAFPLQITRKVPASSSQTRGNSLSQPVDSIINYAYVVNFDENGFIVMGAIDELPEIIAYSDNGSIPNPDNPQETKVNPRVEDFLSDLQLYVLYNCCVSVDDDGSNPILSKHYSPWEGRALNGDGLCPVQWHQSIPYDKYCLDKDGSKVPVGCLTVAVAQMMACYQYPTSYTYVTTDRRVNFDWNLMINDDYPSTGMTPATEMICRLMESLFATENLAIHYDANSGNSLGCFYRVPHTLSHFGYSESGYSTAFNEQEAIKELKGDHPIMLGGYREKSTNSGLIIGHAWLVHGLYEQARTVTTVWRNGERTTKTERQYLFLCNWGHGPNGMNGYYWGNNFNDKIAPAQVQDPSIPAPDKGSYTDLEMYYKIRP